jgi:rhodanese-related sulfurtransferase
MMKPTNWLALGVLAMLALTIVACGAGSAASEPIVNNADGYADISVQQLADMLENKDLTLVNVHVPYEGEIPQTDLFIAYDEIATHLDQLPDKSAAIALYCRSGGMSTLAAEELVELGYSNVLEVDGGFNAWKAAGYELLHQNQ